MWGIASRRVATREMGAHLGRDAHGAGAVLLGKAPAGGRGPVPCCQDQLLPAALHLPGCWGWGRPIPPGSLRKSHPNPAPALGVGGFASAGDTQPRRGTPSGEAAAAESHREKLPRVGRGLWQPRDVQR